MPTPNSSEPTVNTGWAKRYPASGVSPVTPLAHRGDDSQNPTTEGLGQFRQRRAQREDQPRVREVRATKLRPRLLRALAQQ